MTMKLNKTKEAFKSNRKDIRRVLENIKEKMRYTPDGQLIIYPIYYPLQSADGVPTASVLEGNAIFELNDWGVLKIHSDQKNDEGTDFYLEILPKFEKTYAEYERPSNKFLRKQSSNQKLLCGLLSVDFSKGFLMYSNKDPVEISPTTREIKFLKLLFLKNQNIVEYWEFAKELDLPTYRDGLHSNKRYSRDIQAVRRDLVAKYLTKAGMKNNDVKRMILSKTGKGYVLRCAPNSQS